MITKTNLSTRHRNLPMLLLRVREKVFERFRPLITSHGVTEQQWRVMRVLLDSGPLEQRQIAEACQIVGPSMAGILVRMEALRLITKKRIENDKRRVMVTLTSEGLALVTTIASAVESEYQNLEKSVGSETLASVYQSLDRLLVALEDQK